MLLPVLAGVILVAALGGVLRARSLAASATLVRLAEVHRLAVAEMSVAALARSGGVAADGAAVEVERDGHRFEVRVTDVEGLVDLYLAPDRVLRLLEDVEPEARARMLAELGPGERHLSEERTLAAMGLDAARREQLAPFVTQRARTGEINPSLAPPELARAAGAATDRDIAGGDLAEITVRLVE